MFAALFEGVRSTLGGRLRHVLAVAVLAAFVPSPAAAHSFSGGGVEAIPRWLYLTGGGATVLLSFVLVGVFLERGDAGFRARTRRYAFESGPLASVGRVLSVGLYLGVIALGLFGPASFQQNLAPSIAAEIFWWVSYGIFAILVADVWPVVNPWKTLYEWAGEPGGTREYPERLGVWPALVAFLVFSWLNVVGNGFAVPRLVGGAALAYGAFAWVGMAVYGHTWLHRADAFTLVFDYFGRFAPLALVEGGVELRGYAVGLVDERVTRPGEVPLVVAVLYVLSFDGFLETRTYYDLLESLPNPGLAADLWAAVAGLALLVAGYAGFVLAYYGVAAQIAYVTGGGRPAGTVARRFVLTLVPIAAAYHVAHYSLYYLLQHELLVGVLVNPLPDGSVSADPGLVAPLEVTHVWYWTVGLIVVGHVVAVWVAHEAALDFFETRKRAIKSQVPMTLLMIVYTVVSLWIVSQPFGG